MAMLDENKTFYTSPKKNIQESLSNLGKGLSLSQKEPISYYSSYNSDSNLTIRNSYTRKDYERSRPHDAIPVKDAEIMQRCRLAYDKVGILKSIVDLMVEIAIDGLELVSENEGAQNFYDNWATRIDLMDRAEKFATHLLVEGNVAVRRKMAKINTTSVRRWKRSLNAQDTTPEIGNIPVEYIFYDPASLDLIGGELALFSGTKKYGVRIGGNLVNKLMTVPYEEREKLIDKLAPELKAIFRGGYGKKATLANRYVVIPIPDNRLYVDHYKKRDCDIWAKSFIYSVLSDIIYNEKLGLARISALDGFYNAVRIWKVGDHTAEIFPAEGAFSKLEDMLTAHTGGILDLIWDSAIDMDEHYPPIEKLKDFQESFEPILMGMGIHSSFIGGDSNTGTSMTGAFMGLHNMIKRIAVIRRALIKWINTEISIIRENLGIRERPTIKFNISDLYDSRTYFKVLTDLLDRDIISSETILDKIGEDYKIEQGRLVKDVEFRESSHVTKKSPYVQSEIPDKNIEAQKKVAEFHAKLQGNDAPDPEGTPGRPDGSPDKEQRQRRFRTITSANTIVTANNIQDKIDKIVDDFYLVYNNIGNKRKLNSEQKKELELAKTQMLASINCHQIDTLESMESLNQILDETDSNKFNRFMQLYQEMVPENHNYTQEQLRSIKTYIYAEVYS